MLNVLTIAGSDPSSGAGIQGDIKTFTSLGVYGFAVVTALTSQNSSKFFKSEPASPDIIKSQIRSVISDFKIDAIKIGMVYDKKTIKTIYNELKNVKVPTVLDPVFRSTTGGVLLHPDAISDFIKFLIPISHIITPNIPEAEKIAGMKIKSMNDAKKAALKINSLGAKNVVIKGGHMRGKKVVDLLLENKRFHLFSQKRLPRESHGGGCIFSAALCSSLAKGESLPESVRHAQEISLESIRGAARVGRGFSIVRQKSVDMIEKKLSDAMQKFIEIDGIYNYIPEVQTNFVYSKPNPKVISDILGLEGRLIKVGSSVQPVGTLKYGGSRHVGNAVLEVAKKFPSVRSGLNIKYDTKTIKKAIAKRFCVTYYDRTSEPVISKHKEGKTISWGIKSALSKMKVPPDVIYHTGDLGKEPMILIFGKSPKDVLTKLGKIT